MNSIFNQLLNVKGVVVETVRIVDSPLRPEPVLEVRVRPRRGMLRCSPLWQTSSWLRPRWRRASLASSGFRLLAGRTGRHDAARGAVRVGVVVASVPWAEPGSRFTRDFESECAWLMSDQAKTELNHWVFWASHNRIPEIVELARRIRRRAPDMHQDHPTRLLQRQARGVRQPHQGHHPHGLRLPPRHQPHSTRHAPLRRTRRPTPTTRNLTHENSRSLKRMSKYG